MAILMGVVLAVTSLPLTCILALLVASTVYCVLQWPFNGRELEFTFPFFRSSIIRYYFCAVMQSFYFTKGKFYSVYGEQLDRDYQLERTKAKYKHNILGVFTPPEQEKMFVKDCFTLHSNLRLYRECINFAGHHSQIPPVALMSYFNKPIIALGSSYHSRSRILGAIHMSQEVTVYQDLFPLITSYFSMSLNALEYRETERGIEMDVRSCVYDEHDVLVWEGKASGLSLNDSYKPGKRPASPLDANFRFYKEDVIHAPKDLGFKFAKASTDWQPQHINQWTAWMVGFRKPIAHGLWILAVSVEKITRSEACFDQAFPLHIECKFRKPLELDSSALLQFEKPEGTKQMTNFRLVNLNNHSVPYIVGRMYVGAKEVALA